MSNQLYKFEPDYAVYPGQVLEQTLQAQNLSQKELAERTGLSQKTVSQIITGKNPVTAETALGLENVLGISAEVWTGLDADYRLFQARQHAESELDQAVDWAKQFPLAELAKRRYIPSTKENRHKVKALLKLFRVKSPQAWMRRYGNMTVAFRKSATFSSNYYSVVTWLRLAEIEAQKISTPPYSRSQFQANLAEIRKLTHTSPKIFQPKMKELCRQAGVALVFVPELPKTHLSGATQWLRPDKAMIALSLRYKTDDHFWFTFFHEAAHIIKHQKKDVYIDEAGQMPTSQEKDANAYAANLLIRADDYRRFINRRPMSRRQVKEFAQQVAIAPGIVVGRLQHDGIIKFSWLNDLKAKLQLTEANTSTAQNKLQEQ